LDGFAVSVIGRKKTIFIVYCKSVWLGMGKREEAELSLEWRKL
jgi:hypothetical protein